MKKEEFENEYSKAVDIVCINCTMQTEDYPSICDNCPVRKSMCYYETLFNPQFNR